MPPARRAIPFDRTTPPHLVSLILLTSLGALGMNLFLPSLPGMAAYFDTSYGVIQLAVTGYLAVNALMQLVIGPMSDRYGRRRIMLWSIAVFTLASVGGMLSTHVAVFLMFRMIQAAIVAGLILPRAAIRDLYSQNDSASMIGYVTMGMSLVPMIAPAFGGLLDGLFGWQASFAALALAGAAAFALAYYDMGETAAPSTGTLRQQVAQYPQLLMAPRFWGYALTAAFASGAFFAYLGGAPYVGSEVYGMSPEVLGLYFGAPAIGYLVGNGVTGRYAARVGTNPMILIGTVLTVIGLGLSLVISLAGEDGPLVFFGFMTTVGLGNGLVIPNATAGMLSVRPHLAGTASGLGGAIMIGGGAGLSTVAGVILAGSDSSHPLIWLMTLTSAASVLSILFVIWRERRLRMA
ncbi:multidrug effflux MFS transporter [Palleronia rufa]|uniref:multidrug effflux MFS transporter n=1 Tax=Palleronia rufa TaxID=1530186 RepID=UPI00056D45E6|nr:multidrug effflux MFS transporter [Palleronia rufa]